MMHVTQAGAEAVDCKDKLVVTVSVDSGDVLSSQELAFTLKCINRYTKTAENYPDGHQCRCSTTRPCLHPHPRPAVQAAAAPARAAMQQMQDVSAVILWAL